MIEDEDEPRELLIDVVLLHSIDEERTVAVCGDLPVTLSATDPISAGVFRGLFDSRTTLIAPAGVPAAVVRVLTDTAAPPLFGQSPWLREHRALVFVNGRCQVGDHVLVYDERIGVCAEETV